MRVIFFGTPDFSVGTLEALIDAGHQVVLVVTQPDKPKGRGEVMQYTPVKEVALAHDIPVFQPKKIRDPESLKELKKYDADVMVVIAFGQILPKEVLAMTPYGCINVHASLLPAYRGAAPIQWAVINGEKESGVTTMQMDTGLDTGDMIMRTVVPLDEKETGETLHDKLAAAGAALCVETLKALEEKTATWEKQGETTTAYASMLKKDMGKINWSDSAVKIERLIRGLNSWPSAFTYLNGKVLKIWDGDVYGEADGNADEMAPGTIVKIEKDGFFVQCGEGLLKVNELQLQGKKRMDAGAFLRGARIKEGDVL